MSHSTVLVIGEDPEKMLEPFSEELEVEPYRKYDDAERPQDHWSWKGTSEECGLSPDASWPEFVEAFNRRYTDEGLMYDAEADRVYEMSTYNPNSRWDWYALGGRWTGFFELNPGAGGTVGEPGLSTPPAARGRVDQARKRDINWGAMRERHAADARSEYRTAMRALDGHPPLLRWATVREEFGEDIDRARRAYHGQPGMQALHKARIYYDDPAEDLCLRAEHPEAAYVAKIASARSLPFAVLNDDGWHERGRMGWFGVVIGETDDWHERAQALIDAAPENALFSVYDVHI